MHWKNMVNEDTKPLVQTLATPTPSRVSRVTYTYDSDEDEVRRYGSDSDDNNMDTSNQDDEGMNNVVLNIKSLYPNLKKVSLIIFFRKDHIVRVG